MSEPRTADGSGPAAAAVAALAALAAPTAAAAAPDASRCPGCRARLGSAPVCARCGCDLTLARRAQAQAWRLAVLALQAWDNGEPQHAEACAQAALALHSSPALQTLQGGIDGWQAAGRPLTSR